MRKILLATALLGSLMVPLAGTADAAKVFIGPFWRRSMLRPGPGYYGQGPGYYGPGPGYYGPGPYVAPGYGAPGLEWAGLDQVIITTPAIMTAIIIPAMAIAGPSGTKARGFASGTSAAGGELNLGAMPTRTSFA